MKFDITNPIYNDPDAARSHLEETLWPMGPVCPHCKSQDATALHGKAHRKGLYQCNACREQFSVTVGTVFERSKIPLHKWVLASHLMAASKKGMSSKQIERMLGISYKSAWFVMHRLREAMAPAAAKDTGPLGRRRAENLHSRQSRPRPRHVPRLPQNAQLLPPSEQQTPQSARSQQRKPRTRERRWR